MSGPGCKLAGWSYHACPFSFPKVHMFAHNTHHLITPPTDSLTIMFSLLTDIGNGKWACKDRSTSSQAGLVMRELFNILHFLWLCKVRAACLRFTQIVRYYFYNLN